MASRGSRRANVARKRAPQRAAKKRRQRAAFLKKLAAEEDGTALPPGVYLSVSQAAAEFGNDRRTITKRIAELGIRPAEERQGYAVYRLRDLLDIERRGAQGETDPSKLNPFERHAFYKAESERLRVNLERGELLRRDQVEQEWARVLKLIALELDTLVDEVERDVGASSLVLDLIEKKIDAMRERAYAGMITHYEEATTPEAPPDGDGTAPPPD